ncbi:hypothetical protein [Thermaurantiacus sp.]
MNIPPADLLRNLALGQALLVAPALGESYAGKTAGTIAAILLLAASDVVLYAERRASFRNRLHQLLADAAPDDITLRADLAALLARVESLPLDDRLDHLLGGLEVLHAFADARDPELARACLEFLFDFAAAERLDPPGLPA